MSLNLPILRGTGRRRAVDKVIELRAENVILLGNLHTAGDAIALLRQDLADAHAKQAETEQEVVQLQADIDYLIAERDGLAEELDAFKRRFAEQLAAEANANRVDVPPMLRDASALEDQATAPIDVRPLWQALGVGPVTDPGRIH